MSQNTSSRWQEIRSDELYGGGRPWVAGVQRRPHKGREASGKSQIGKNLPDQIGVAGRRRANVKA